MSDIKDDLCTLIELVEKYKDGGVTVSEFTKIREIMQRRGKIVEFYSEKHNKCISYIQWMEVKLFYNFVV